MKELTDEGMLQLVISMSSDENQYVAQHYDWHCIGPAVIGERRRSVVSYASVIVLHC